MSRNNIIVTPGLLTKSYDDLHAQVTALKGAAEWLHVDVMDGGFVEQTSTALTDIPDDEFSGFQVEAHLMVEDPIALFGDCKRLGMRRVVVHYEAVQEGFDEAIISAHEVGLQIVAALNPGTNVSYLESYGHLIDGVLLMSVTPGMQGQLFMPEVLKKVPEVRLLHDSILIGLDGGINEETIDQVGEYNFDYIVVGSAIARSDNPAATLNSLQNAT
ncbi:MAG: ribulose-phosphate 3-epimerase [Patescibacteria group bacterium]